MPTSGSCLPLASRFSKRSGSRESIQPSRRHPMCLRHSVSLLTLCPLGQPKKAIGHESQIEVWLTHADYIRFACRASEIESSPHLSFLSSSILSERSSPSRGRCAAPLTAPGRSEEHSSDSVGGIRLHDRLDGSASYRFCVALNAKLVTDAVDHCTLLHAGQQSEFSGAQANSRKEPHRRVDGQLGLPLAV
jgi:hypothetical protein